MHIVSYRIVSYRRNYWRKSETVHLSLTSSDLNYDAEKAQSISITIIDEYRDRILSQTFEDYKDIPSSKSFQFWSFATPQRRVRVTDISKTSLLGKPNIPPNIYPRLIPPEQLPSRTYRAHYRPNISPPNMFVLDLSPKQFPSRTSPAHFRNPGMFLP